jgi:zinc protease
LLGRPAPASADEVAAQIDATTVEGVQRAAYDLWTDLLVSVDPDGAGDPQLAWLGAAPAPAGKPSGRQFRSIDSPESNDLLFVSETEARLQTATGPSAARYDELAGVLAFEDGGRRLVRQDGFQVPVEPTLWRKGPEAVALVDAALPEGLRIPLPARSPEEIPWKRVRRIDNFRNWVQSPKVWVPALYVCVALPVIVALSLPTFITKVLVVGSALGVINFVRQQRGR